MLASVRDANFTLGTDVLVSIEMDLTSGSNKLLYAILCYVNNMEILYVNIAH